ncbi:major facilitator superfamily domain-containing protein [Mucor mucedo]|uniref:major facilitator superfamily domain-containing protein n=1 Tax=Mucor mucedo TaxID=29922 RepID=UPI00221ECBBA|nr:major facilitator superfamily domain-containing protein [Mucor mucedo]KAI7891270.1 major facilitator superfamily domain-containing protein [Mucor mucedo]
MMADNQKLDRPDQKSSKDSQSTRNSGDLEDDQKTFQCTEDIIEEEQHNPEHYPGVLEYAPFPALGSLEEITQTLSRVKSNQTQKSEKNNAFTTDYIKEDVNAFKQEAYHTDGIRNPGWLTVLSCFLVNFFVFGSTFSWGIYQKLYISEVYAGQTSLLKIAFVGTSASALLLALGMFITPVIQKIGFRGTMAIGTVFSPLALILASFATELWHVYLSQGVLFGLASAFVFSPSVTLPSQWFTSRRALATGIAVSGSGVGGVCLSPMIQKLILTIGFRNTLRVQGAFGFGLLCISTALATSRYRPPPSSNGKNKWYHVYDASLLSRRFVLLLCFSFFVPFGYVAPFFLAPSYCEYIGLDASTGAVMISVMSAANAICRIALGYLADRTGRFNG